MEIKFSILILVILLINFSITSERQLTLTNSNSTDADSSNRTNFNETEIQEKIPKTFCGYEVPSKNDNCFSRSEEDHDCCVLDYRTKKACLPQMSNSFRGKRAYFTIDGENAYISCKKTDTMNQISSATQGFDKFFEFDLCGNKFGITNDSQCQPVYDSETSKSIDCCYLESIAYLDDPDIITRNPATKPYPTKILRTCIRVDNVTDFQNSVMAQTCFLIQTPILLVLKKKMKIKGLRQQYQVSTT